MPKLVQNVYVLLTITVIVQVEAESHACLTCRVCSTAYAMLQDGVRHLHLLRFLGVDHDPVRDLLPAGDQGGPH